ncbi:MAG: glycerol-3-phosphate acyltransferase [Acidimicrobiales bacterium]
MDAWWLLVVVSYVIGAFPTAQLIGRFTGNDPTSEGSGNPGASNMFRVAGKRAGALVLFGDGLKGFVPAAVGFAAGGRPLGLACGLAAMMGHVLPFARGSRVGGKGVATLAGASAFLYPLVAISLLIVWVVLTRVSRTPAIGSLVIALALPVGVAARGRPAWEVAAMAAASGVVIVRHWSNIKRLAHHEEQGQAG